MSGRETRRSSLEAICRTILPAAFDSGRAAGSSFPAGDASARRNPGDPGPLHLPTLVERRIASLPPRQAAGLRLAIGLLASRSVVCALTGRPLPFHRLSPAARDAMLARMETSGVPKLRTLFQALRRVVVSSWYSEPDAQAEIGHLPPLGRRERLYEWEGREDGSPAVPDEGHQRAAVHRAARGLEPGRRLTADVVIVGSGAGGAVAAAILAEAGREVLVLEEGRAWPLEERTGIERDMVPRLYAEAGARATDDQSIQILQGRALGGSTFVNWMLMLRTPDEVLHEWSTQHGMEGVDPASMAPVFAEIEREVTATRVGDAAHSRNNRLLLKGAARLGLHAGPATINASGCERSGLCGMGCPWAAKQSVDETWLPRALRAGARIATGARARRIERAGPDGPGRLGARKRVLVEVAGPDGRPSGQATVETPLVIVAAGAVGTPSLLQRSGLGGGGVGRFLRLHPTSAVAALHDEPVHAATGIPMSVVCRPEAAPDPFGYWLECPPMHPGLAAVAMPGFGERHRRVMVDYARMATTIVLVRDGAASASQGSVRTDARGRPRIRYLLGETERASLTRGITMAARLQLAAGAREVTTLHAHGAPIRTEADLGRIAAWPAGPNELCVFSAHVMGTARIGTNPATSACRPDGQRHGARGVHVIDGSVLPTAPGVNPQETIMAVATVLARRLV